MLARTTVMHIIVAQTTKLDPLGITEDTTIEFRTGTRKCKTLTFGRQKGGLELVVC